MCVLFFAVLVENGCSRKVLTASCRAVGDQVLTTNLPVSVDLGKCRSWTAPARASWPD